MARKRISVIGAGISGISAAAYAAKAGHDVHVYEKNATPGGRARQFETHNGYVFDMGPSWYWMPDIINDFFRDFGYDASDFYELVPLDPQFEIIFSNGRMTVPSDYGQLRALFAAIEPGADRQLDSFMKAARYKYEAGMNEFVQKPCHSWWEFATPKLAASAFRLNLLSNYRSYVKQYFSHPWLISLMEFPVIFLGASPKQIPALYSLMAYGGYALGTWYPMGGFYQLVLAMKKVAEEQGAYFHFNSPVEQINTSGKLVTGLQIAGQDQPCDAVIASSDYSHTETLLPPALRNYDKEYWESRTFAPSCLIYYLGVNTSIPNIRHHTLFFEHDLDTHVDEIYQSRQWPSNPLFYVCCPSKTDPAVAPAGHENLFLLMPLATGLEDNEPIRERYLDIMLRRIEKATGCKDLAAQINYKKSYCVHDFIHDYNAFGGNAYGLANTLKQTAVGKPAIRSRKLDNLLFTGQLTVPGPGVPPSLISGKIAAAEIKNLKKFSFEKSI